MTRLWNDPARFRDDMTAGFIAAHADQVVGVPGGIVRASRDAEPAVAVVVGGGSGHYPAFAGLVGPGLAHGAVMGNIFASPSAAQVESVALAAEDGRGVLLAYGNYAGDVLNFDLAQANLRSRGLDVRTVAVTDDICSAPVGAEHLRRGIAGDLAVFKIAGAAAAEGRALDAVEELAARANRRTRTVGVAFGGCTLPGADAPLFEVPEGRMAVGMGIHGEPGLEELPVPSARGLAELLVERILAERPSGPAAAENRVVPLLNGLGGIGDEELYVVYARVAELLDEEGIVAVDPQVGQLCTSFDMPGVSLSLLWLDEDLERLWSAPANAPAFRTGAPAPTRDRGEATVQGPASVAGSPDSSDPSAVIAALEAVRRVVLENADLLGRLDSVAGDGDHGIGMSRGATAAADAAHTSAARGLGAAATLHDAADAWSDAAGGTSGALWSLMLHRLADALAGGRPDAARIADAVASACDAVTAAGGAVPGDKTMVDALVPFTTVLVETVAAGADGSSAWTTAARTATDGAKATADMVPRRGRSRTHGERAVGTPDPGAVSFALIVTAVGDAFADTTSYSDVPQRDAKGART
jgi:dihydroxyacetone kinase